jgi:hypothetical protein
MPPFTDLPACAGLVGPGVRVGEGLGTRVEVAENRDWDLGVGSGVPTPPPQPTKENTTRDKQINERVPWTQKVSWRRIDYLPGNIRWTALGMQSWIIISYPKMSIDLIVKFLLSGLIINPEPLFGGPDS